ncbi:hypothetical protein FOYG_14738 [Fusarium oxysporum NRRL 32931]|uniref:Uncharacterized protein n=1 Tax=Fusarium oxysporum NRRL 32931 TaxID=660029 RepID=W9HQZ4_FUSOX|nr:hypothetical protein FOYG_14738 [Fusarium oxysporum NRRL 32931]
MSRFTTVACCLALFVLSGVSAGPFWPSWPSSSVPMSSLEMTSTISQLAESTAAVVSSSTFTKPFQTISTAVSTDVTSSTYSTTTTEAQAGPGISLIAATTIATTTTSADIESEDLFHHHGLNNYHRHNGDNIRAYYDFYRTRRAHYLR